MESPPEKNHSFLEMSPETCRVLPKLSLKSVHSNNTALIFHVQLLLHGFTIKDLFLLPVFIFKFESDSVEVR